MGLEYPLAEISEEERKKDLIHMMARDNHKSAQTPIENALKLQENYKLEVEKGWMLSIPAACLPKLKGAAVIPVGVHTQQTIGEDGERKINGGRHTTHHSPRHRRSLSTIG